MFNQFTSYTRIINFENYYKIIANVVHFLPLIALSDQISDQTIKQATIADP